MDQRYKEYLKNQGKVDSVCIWDVPQDRDRAPQGLPYRAFAKYPWERVLYMPESWLLLTRWVTLDICFQKEGGTVCM